MLFQMLQCVGLLNLIWIIVYHIPVLKYLFWEVFPFIIYLNVQLDEYSIHLLSTWVMLSTK